MKDGQLYWSFVDPIWDRVSIYDGPELFLDQFSKITEVQKHLFASHWCQSEVRNGGLHQFFSNDTGVLAPEAVAGFRVIGMNTCADALERAMKFFGSEYPRERSVRADALDALELAHPDDWDPFTEMDDVMFSAFEGQGFDRAADAYAATATN